jgi:Flp pilus assembly protein TadG
VIDLTRRLALRAAAFLPDTSAIAAVELALIAPVALGMMTLAVAGGQAMVTNHRVVNAAHTVTDLVSRTPYSPDSNTQGAEALAPSQLQTDLAMAAMIMYPDSTMNLTVVMSELKVNAGNNTGVVIWSCPSTSYPGTALAKGAVIPLDSSYVASGATYLLYGQATYNFQPFGGIWSLSPITLSSTETLTIRNAPQITLTSCS